MATEQYNDTNATVSGNEELNEALGNVTPQGVEMRIAQASGDPVPVDVGEGEPEAGAEAEVAVEIPAEVTPDAENVVRLPEGVSIEDIRVDGPNLVLVQPDGSRVTVVNAALDIPTFIIGDVEIAPEVLVAALEAQGIDVAAGPDGTFSVVSGTTSTNANFNEPLPGIGDAGPPIDLLPPTALAFEQLDGEELGPLDVSGPEFGDFGGDFFDGGFLRLLEPSLDLEKDGADIQAGTTTGTDPVGTGETRIGTIALTAGTSAVTSVYFFDPTSPSFVAPVISGVEPGTPALTWTMNPEGQLIGSLNGVEVVIMEITAPLPIPATQTADVTIKVTLLDAFPHVEGEGPNEVTISGIQIGATDANGLSADTTFGVIIVDDVPVDEGGDRDWTLDEDVLPGGNDDLDVPADTNDYLVLTDKDLGIDWGADGPGGAVFDALAPVVVRDGDGNIIATPLSSGGVALVYTIVDTGNGQTLTATKGDGGEVVFTLTIDPDGGENGQFDFTLSGTLDHPMADGQNTLQLHFPFTATDGDGDPIESSIVIRVTDDVPYVVPSNFLFNGDFNDLPGSGTDYGDYFISSVLPGWTIAQSPEGDPSGTPQFEIVDNGYLGMSVPSGNAMIDLGASPGNVQISQDVAGLTAGQQYAIQFYAGAPYPDTAGLKVFWGGELIATIEPGAVMTAYTLIVTAGGNPGDNQLTFMETGTGNDPIPGFATEGYHGTYLADIAVKAVNFVDEDGLPAGIGDSQTGDAVVPDVDGDGNEATTIGSLGILWGADNTDLPDTGGLQDGANTELFGRHVVFTNANVTVAGAAQAELTSGGVPVTYVLSHNNTVLTGMAGDKAVFRVTLFDDGQGSYKFELLAELDHAPGADENDIVLGFNFTATDFDGDSATGSFLIGVDDDVPVVDVDSKDRSTVTHDESAWPQNVVWNFFGPSGDRDDDDVGVIASVLKVSQLFSGVGDTGDDPDVPALAKAFFHGAIGYAQSQASLVTVNANYGADGPAGSNALVYALKLGGGESGLKTTEGHDIVLSKEGDLIVGRVQGGDHDGQAAIAIHVDPETGKVTIAQWLSLEHGNVNSHDEAISLGENAVLVEVTVTDGDGDKHSDSVDVSNQIRFEDDGPKLEKFQLKSGAKVVHDETPGVDDDANDTDADLAALFSGIGPVGNDPHVPGSGAIGYAKVSGGSLFHVSADFGSDGPLGGGYAYTLEIGTKTTSLKTTEGHAIELKLVDGIIVGVVKEGPFAGKAAFAIHIDEASGDVTLAQYLSLQHPINPDNYDEAVWLAANNVKVRLTVTDGDGDTDSEVVSIGGKIGFQDDGPSVDVDSKDRSTVTHDESAWPQNVVWNFFGPSGDRDDDDVGVIASVLKVSQLFSGVDDTGDDPDVPALAKAFFHGAIGYAQSQASLVTVNVNYGADGPAGSNALVYALKLGGGESGLKTTEGHEIVLSLEGDLIVGRVEGGDHDGQAAIAIHVDPETGKVTIAQWLSLEHGNVNSHDEAISLGENAVLVEVTVTDGDGDKHSDSVDVSNQIRFEDDGPKLEKFQLKSGAKVVHDETPGVDDDANDTDADLAALFSGIGPVGNDPHVPGSGAIGYAKVSGGSLFHVSADFGSDGPLGGGYAYTLEIGTKTTSLKTTEGHAIELKLVDGIIVGVVKDGPFAGKAAFAIHIDEASGDVTLAQYLSLQHPINPDNHDEAVWLAANNVKVRLTVTDGDGDTDSEVVSIGGKIGFQDDGPTADDTDAGKILDDEAQPGGIYGGPGDNGWGKSVSGQLDIDGGSDGIKSITFSKFPTVKNENGETVGLKAIWVDGEGVGHPRDVTVAWTQNGVGGTLVGTADDIGKVFELTVNADGSYTFKLLAPLSHPLTTDGDAFVGSYEDLLALGFKFTVTDGDGDKASAKLTIEVDDDSPTILGIEQVGHGPNLVRNGSFEDGHSLTGSNWDIFKSIDHWSQGADGVPFEVQTGGAGGVGAQDGYAIIELDGDTQTNGQGGNGTPQAATNATIQQAIEGTVAGQAYKLTFHYAVRPDGVGSSGMEVWFGGVKVYTIADNAGIPANVWQQITIDVTAPSDDAVLEFRGTGAPNEFGALLDNVSMHGISPILVHDETQGVQVGADPNDQDDVAGAGLPGNILALFNAIAQKGSDDDVDPKDNNAIGFARSGAENPAFQFSANFGADGAHAQNAVAYALQTENGTDSGLKTTEGQSILLYNEGGLIVGKIADGTVAFAVAIDPATGELFLAQYLSIKHGFAGDGSNGSHDELATILSGAIKATVTIKDGDGDSVTSDAVSIGHLIGFQDDGPSVSLDGTNALANGLFFDGFTPNNNAWGIGSGVATGTAGEWTITASPNSGAASPELQKVASGYRGAISPTGSLIVDMEASPGNIQITQEVSGLVDGHTYRLSFEIGEAADINAEAAENSAILEVWWNGELIGTYHPASGLMQTIVVDVVAGAGPNELQFREVGASGDNTGTFLANVKLSDVVIIDETPGLDADADDTANPLVAALFDGINGGVDPHMAAQFAQGSKAVVSPTIDFGSDGPAAGGGIAYSLSIVEGADSGLKTTEGEPILLYLDGAGRVIGVYDGTGAAGEVAIAFHIDPATGFISVAQYVSLAHPDTDSSDEGVYLKPGSLGVTVTVTDGDGDTASASTDISGLVRFEDDGPTAVDTVAGKVLDDERQAGGIDGGPGDQAGGNYRFVKGKLDIDGGADGVKSIVFAEAVTVKDELPGSEVGTLLQAIHVDPDTKVGTPRNVELDWQADGNGGGKLTGTATGIGTVFELTVDKDGNYTFKLFAPLSHPLTTDGDAFVGSYEDLLALGFSFTVTDGDGDEATATLTIKVDDDSPMLGEGGIEALSEIASGPGTHTGAIDFKPGADGIGKALLLANDGREPAGLEYDGQQVKYFVDENNPDVLIAHVGDDPTDPDSQVFKLTVDPVAGNYELEIFKQIDFVSGGGSTTIGNGTAYGTSNVASADLSVNDIDLGTVTGFTADGINFGNAASVDSWITAWLGGSPNLDPSTVNGSNQGWGADGNNALGEGEFLRFDFTGGDVAPQSTAFALNNFPQAGSVVVYWKVTYSDGSTDDGIVNDPAPSSQALAIPGLDGETIETVEFFIREPGTGQGGKIDLVSVTTGEQITDIPLDFHLILTDGDGDGVTGKIEITLDGYQAPTGPTGDPLALKVKEEALGDGVTPSSQDGSNPTSDAEKDEGTLTFIQGSAPLTFAFAGTPVVSGNSAVTWVLSDDGKTYTGSITILSVQVPVIKLTLVAGAPGAGGAVDVTVEVELLDNIPGHPGDGKDLIDITGIVVEADDGTGNPLGSVNGQLTIQVKDDVPEVDAFVQPDADLARLKLTVDETDDADGDRYNDNDDQAGDSNPNTDGNGVTPGLGSVTTKVSGGLLNLFGSSVKAGADGLTSLDTVLSLRLVGADPVDGTLETTLKTIGGETIYLKLVKVGDEEIVTGVADGATIFTIAFTPIAPVQLSLTMHQAIMHGDNSKFDENEVLKLAGDGAVQLVYSRSITDGDGDEASDEATIDLVTKTGGYFSFDDDGPTLSLGDDIVTGEGAAATTGNWSHDFGSDGVKALVFKLAGEGGSVVKSLTKTEYDAFMSGSDPIELSRPGFGKITIYKNGTYSFLPTNDMDADASGSFTIEITDGDGDKLVKSIEIAVKNDNDVTVTLSEAAFTVDEAGLSDGSNAGNAPVSDSGTMNFSALDGVGSVTVTDKDGNPVPVHSHDFGDGPLVVEGKYGTLTITGYTFNPATGEGSFDYEYELVDNTTDHDDPGQTGAGDTVGESFLITVTDTDGDSDTGTLAVTVKDDGPLAKDDTDAVSNATDTATGNVITGADTTSGQAGADTPGADGGQVSHFVAGTVFGNVTGSTPDAVAAGGEVQGVYGKLTIDANGGYLYTREDDAPLSATDVFTYTLRDGDGDLSTATITITIADNDVTLTNLTPAASGGDASVFEKGLAARSGEPAGSGETGDGSANDDPSESTTGTFNFTSPDGLGSLTIGTTVITLGQLQAAGGTPITIAGGPVYGKLEIIGFSGSATGGEVTYRFTLLDNVAHPGINDTGIDDQLFVDYAVVVEDADGDSQGSTLSIAINDDGPTAKDDTVDDLVGDAGIEIDVKANDIEGADGVDWSLAGGKVVLHTAPGAGAVTYLGNGIFKYVPSGDNTGTDSFKYSITDGDGDVSVATVTLSNIDVDDEPEIVIAATNLVLDEDSLPGSNQDSGQLTEFTAPTQSTGSVTVDFGNDLPADPAAAFSFLATGLGGWTTTSGAPVTFALDGNGDLVGSAGGSEVVRISLTSADVNGTQVTFNYEAELSKALRHPENDNEDDIGLTIAFEVQDGSGDKTGGNFNLTVWDDVPTAPDTTAIATAGVKPTLNAIFVIDLSASMGTSSPDPLPGNPSINTRLQLLQSSVANLLNNSDVAFNDIVIYTFNAGAAYRGTFDKAGALNFVQVTLGTLPLVTATQYDTAAAAIQADYPTRTVDPADKTFLYFLTDGDPQGSTGSGNNYGLDTPAEQAAWLNFLNAEDIDQVFAVGFGGVGSPAFLNPMAPRDGDVAFPVLDPAQLSAVLEGSLPGNPSGNVFEDQAGVVLGGFGADGGYVKSLTFGDVTFEYNGTATITPASGGNGTITWVVSANGKQIVITDQYDGKMIFNFAANGLNKAGDWDYFAPDDFPNAGAILPQNLGFGFTLVDGDGDQDTGSLTLTLKAQLIPEITVPAAGNSADGTLVDEKNLPEGTAPNAGLLKTAGTFTYTDGNGIGILKINGEDAGVGDTIEGAYGSIKIVAISAPDANGVRTVSYEYTLEERAQHSVVNQTGNNDRVNEAFSVTVEDEDGDVGSATLNVAINDDGPIADLVHAVLANAGGIEANGSFAIAGADGPLAVSIGAYTTGLKTADGQAVAYTNANGVVTAYVQGGSAGNPADQVFKMTLNPDGTYKFELFKEVLAYSVSTGTVTGALSAIDVDGRGGDNVAAGYILTTSSGAHMALVSGWDSTNPTQNGDMEGVSGDHTSGWGVGTNLGGGELLRFDFTRTNNPFGVPQFAPGSFAGVNAINAFFTFRGFGSGSHTVNVRVVDVDGGVHNTTATFNGSTSSLTGFSHPSGKLIDYISFTVPSGQSGRVDLESVNLQGAVGDANLQFSAIGTDMDGDWTNSIIHIKIDKDATAINGDGKNEVIVGDPAMEETLTGGAGADVFVLNSLDVADIIADYGNGGDVLDLSLLLEQFNALPGNDPLTAEQFIAGNVQYNQTTGSLKVDANDDGNFGSDEEVAVLSNTPVSATIRILIDDQTYNNSGEPI